MLTLICYPIVNTKEGVNVMIIKRAICIILKKHKYSYFSNSCVRCGKRKEWQYINSSYCLSIYKSTFL